MVNREPSLVKTRQTRVVEHTSYCWKKLYTLLEAHQVGVLEPAIHDYLELLDPDPVRECYCYVPSGAP